MSAGNTSPYISKERADYCSNEFSDTTEPAKVTFVILNYNVTMLTTNLIVKNFRAEAGLQKISKAQPTSTEIKLYL